MHWIDLDRVNKAIEQSGDTSDHNFRVECISAPYYNNNVARVVLHRLSQPRLLFYRGHSQKGIDLSKDLVLLLRSKKE